MFCSKCGKPMSEDAAFCSGCGTRAAGQSADSHEQLDNYLNLAFTALQSFNKEDALRYANKILESDSTDFRGWAVKAKATGLGSSLNQNEIPQAIGAAKSAVGFAPENVKTQVVDDCYWAIKTTLAALLNLAQQMPMAMVPGALNAFGHIHAVMTQWLQMVADIPCLSRELIMREVQDCEMLCQKSKSAIMPGKRKLYAAATGARIQGGYHEEMKRALQYKGIYF